VPRARAQALAALARAALAEPALFEPCGTTEETVARLCAVRGVGDWTAHYIALRAGRDPDAFPAGDRGIQRGMQRQDGAEWSADALTRRAERWRPWRAYAAQHLWAADAAHAAAPAQRAADGDATASGATADGSRARVRREVAGASRRARRPPSPQASAEVSHAELD